MTRTTQGLLVASLLALALVGLAMWHLQPSAQPPGDWRDPATCRRCHAKQYADWEATNHAEANREVRADRDATAFLAAPPTLTIGLEASDLGVLQADDKRRHLQLAIGREPLVQYAFAQDGGRWEVMPLAFHLTTQSWFNVFGADASRAASLNWNSQCAYCHMTALHKRYDAQKDVYRTTWDRHGVGCHACHRDMQNHVERATGMPPAKRARTVAEPPPAQTLHTCAACHMRREELTAEAFQPGDRIDDHFLPELPDRPDIYFADGQVRDEVFEAGSFLLSRMGGHGGVQCIDCHEPHSLQLRAPLVRNQLCLTCHATGVRGARLIPDPPAHSHHAPESAGNQCESCHMPVTQFMQRDPRRDHGFTTPDPLLTIEVGIPNACNRCHTDRDASWAQTAAAKWYGDRLETRQRRRARAVATASTARDELLALLESEDVVGWQAALTGLLGAWATEPRVTDRLRVQLRTEAPLVRAAAVRALAEHPRRQEFLRTSLQDPSRLVRVLSGFALRDEIAHDRNLASPELRREVTAWLDQNADSALGALRRAEWALLDGDRPAVVLHVQHAVRLAPNDPQVSAEARALLHAIRQK